MRFATVTLFAALLLLASCGEDEAPSVDLLTVTMNSSFSTDATENWIVIYNNDGELLAHRKVTIAESATLSSSGSIPGDKITVVVLSIYAGGGSKTFYSGVYTDISPGDTWDLKRAPLYPPGPKLGTVTVNVNTPTVPGNFFVTDKYGFMTTAASGPTTGTYTGDIYSAKLNVMYRPYNGELKHKLITGVKNSDVLNFSPSDLVDYDTKVTFTVPGTPVISFYSMGFESDWKYPNQGYVLDLHTADNFNPVINTGYISSLSQFYTSILLRYDNDGSVEYTKAGAVPNPNISWPDHTGYTISDKSLANYTATTAKPITYRKTTYQVNDGPNSNGVWIVSTPTLNVKIPEMPSEILDAHPSLARSKANHTNTWFYVSGTSYSDYVRVSCKDGGMGDTEQIAVTRH